MTEKLSLCMIVKNEEKKLESFLRRIAKFVDEIIIIDTGSIDKTKKIASKYTDKVFDFKWRDDFSAARNFSLSKASGDWIIVLDPDEIVSDLIKLKKIIKNNADVLGFRLIQKSYHKKKLISVRGICRVFTNNKRIKFVYPIHETARESIKKMGGRIGKTGIVIKHYPTITRDKQKYYLKLLKIKKTKFPKSNAQKEIENELKLFKCD